MKPSYENSVVFPGSKDSTLRLSIVWSNDMRKTRLDTYDRQHGKKSKQAASLILFDFMMTGPGLSHQSQVA
jgi:hypothetical protein